MQLKYDALQLPGKVYNYLFFYLLRSIIQNLLAVSTLLYPKENIEQCPGYNEDIVYAMLLLDPTLNALEKPLAVVPALSV